MILNAGDHTAYCDECVLFIPIVDEFDDQIGYEEKARDVHVIALDCGHDIVTDLPRTYYSAER